MNKPIKIKLTIADRIYPLTIPPAQEEGVRLAARRIEEMIRKFEQSYAVRDKQDVLAMCALQFAAQIEQEDIDRTGATAEAESRLKELDAMLARKMS